MITRIQTVADVQAFAEQLVDEGLGGGFHPDDDFCDYVNELFQPIYSNEEAQFRNHLMEQCFQVCERYGVDVYETIGRITLKGTPAESIFDEDHEQKYEEFMRKVENGEIQTRHGIVANSGVLQTFLTHRN